MMEASVLPRAGVQFELRTQATSVSGCWHQQSYGRDESGPLTEGCSGCDGKLLGSLQGQRSSWRPDGALSEVHGSSALEHVMIG